LGVGQNVPAHRRIDREEGVHAHVVIDRDERRQVGCGGEAQVGLKERRLTFPSLIVRKKSGSLPPVPIRCLVQRIWCLRQSIRLLLN
jgi:hypothetical protein